MFQDGGELAEDKLGGLEMEDQADSQEMVEDEPYTGHLLFTSCIASVDRVQNEVKVNHQVTVKLGTHADILSADVLI